MNQMIYLNSFKQITYLCALIVTMLSAIVLLGWTLDVVILKNLLPHYLTMKPNTAVCFFLAGLALWMLNKDKITLRQKHYISLIALVIFLIGFLTLCEYLFQVDLGFDELLFKDESLFMYGGKPGRMAPMTAINLCFVSLVFVSLNRAWAKYRVAQVFIMIVFIVSLFEFSGYLFEEQGIYGLALYTKISLHAALAFIVLSVGMLTLQAGKGLMVVFTSESYGGTLVRRLMPIMILLPLVLGWLRVQGENLGWYQSDFGVVLFSTAIIPMLMFIVYWNAYRMMQTEYALEEKSLYIQHKEK